MCVIIYICTICVPGPREARKGGMNPLNWNYRLLGTTQLKCWELNSGTYSSLQNHPPVPALSALKQCFLGLVLILALVFSFAIFLWLLSY